MGKNRQPNKKTDKNSLGLGALAALSDLKNISTNLVETNSSISSITSEPITLQDLFNQVQQIRSNLRIGIFSDMPKFLNHPESFSTQAPGILKEAIKQATLHMEKKELVQLLKPSPTLNKLLETPFDSFEEIWTFSITGGSNFEFIKILYNSDLQKTFDANVGAILEQTYEATKKTSYSPDISQHWAAADYILTQTTAINSPYVAEFAKKIKIDTENLGFYLRLKFKESSLEFYNKIMVLLEQQSLQQSVEANKTTLDNPGSQNKATRFKI